MKQIKICEVYPPFTYLACPGCTRKLFHLDEQTLKCSQCAQTFINEEKELVRFRLSFHAVEDPFPKSRLHLTVFGPAVNQLFGLSAADYQSLRTLLDADDVPALTCADESGDQAAFLEARSLLGLADDIIKKTLEGKSFCTNFETSITGSKQNTVAECIRPVELRFQPFAANFAAELRRLFSRSELNNTEQDNASQSQTVAHINTQNTAPLSCEIWGSGWTMTPSTQSGHLTQDCVQAINGIFDVLESSSCPRLDTTTSPGSTNTSFASTTIGSTYQRSPQESMRDAVTSAARRHNKRKKFHSTPLSTASRITVPRGVQTPSLLSPIWPSTIKNSKPRKRIRPRVSTASVGSAPPSPPLNSTLQLFSPSPKGDQHQQSSTLDSTLQLFSP